jgi:hypothetical protein
MVEEDKTEIVVPVNHLKSLVQIVVKKIQYRSNQEKDVVYFAAIVSDKDVRAKVKLNPNKKPDYFLYEKDPVFLWESKCYLKI